MKKNKSKLSGRQVFSIATAVITFLAHIIVIALVVMSYKYYGLEFKTFIGLIGAIVTLLVIIDILFIVGFNFRDHKIKVVLFILSTLILVSGLGGTFLLGKVNHTVGQITSNSGVDQYEEIGVNFVTYKNDSIKEIKDLKGKKVGVVASTSVSATTAGQSKLEKEGISVKYEEYTTLNDLFLGLLNEEIDCAIFQTGYRSILKTNDAYEEYIEEVVDVYTFNEKIKVGENASANKNLTVEPFNILLIGFAPEEGGGGLADSIILASVNPQSLTVTLTSIPRDSYVPIACYAGNAKDKITHSRAYGRECLMDTVGDLFDVEIDFYMEINFQGLADVVDALGGIWIDSPVEFVGQTPSSKRGEYTVWVGKGGQMANGNQALAFARERHAMPNGDLDRAIHQQEVIKEIAGKLINLRDVNKALDVLKVAGDNFSTNLSISQLTSIFNYIVSLPVNGGISKMLSIDIQSMRLAGYGSRSYNVPMQLPLYVFPLYKGSVNQCKNQIADTLGNYNRIEQDDYFKFFVEYPYNRGPLYDDYFDEVQVHEELPGFVLNFVSNRSSVDEVKAWAEEYGVNLEIEFIQDDDPRYVEGADGLVVDMSEKYGLLVSNLPNNTFKVWVCGELDPALKIPNFIGSTLKYAKEWAALNGYKLNINLIKEKDTGFVPEKAGLIFEQSIKAGEDKRDFTEITISVYELPRKKVDLSNLSVNISTEQDVISWLNTNGVVSGYYTISYETTSEIAPGLLVKTPTWYNADGSLEGPFADSIFSFVISKAPEVAPETGGGEGQGTDTETENGGDNSGEGELPENGTEDTESDSEVVAPTKY